VASQPVVNPINTNRECQITLFRSYEGINTLPEVLLGVREAILSNLNEII
jgi:hypothetical protein